MKKTRAMVAASSAAALLAFGQYAQADDKEAAPGAASSDKAEASESVAMPGNFLFTDDKGRPRNPSPEELIAASEALQEDLARLSGKGKGKKGITQQTHANGAVSATIAPSKLVFLTVQENADGTHTLQHTVTDEDGNVSAEPVATLPEM